MFFRIMQKLETLFAVCKQYDYDDGYKVVPKIFI